MAEKLLLLKTQKNEIFEILQEEGLEPADFNWSEEESIHSADLIVSRLTYRDTDFYYQFDFFGKDRYHTCEYSPGGEKKVQTAEPVDWHTQLRIAKIWASCLKKEIDAPDLWQELEKYQATFSLALPTKFKLLNEPIPAYEVEQIVKALDALKQEIKEQFKLTKEESEFVTRKLDYLADAAKRQGRLDWVHTCIGVLITIAMGLSMAPTEASKLWLLVKELLGKFMHLIGP